MARPSKDVLEIVDAVTIQSDTRCTVLGRPIEVDDDAPPGDALHSLLAAELYQRLYCRPSRLPRSTESDYHATRSFVDTLSRANGGHGTWDPGWVVTAIGEGGGLVLHKHADDLSLWAAPGQFRAAGGTVGVGSVGRLALGKELREMLPGFYTVLGDADMPGTSPESGAIVRLYWHLRAEAASKWIQNVSQSLNEAGIPFRAKVLNSPSAYSRADAGVLYITASDYGAVTSPLAAVYRSIADDLRPATPMFTKQLVPGLAVAEDPGDGSSFGQHRCGLVADGLLSAHEEGRTARSDVADAIALRFAEEGLRLGQAWLSHGSRRRYTWPTRSDGKTIAGP